MAFMKTLFWMGTSKADLKAMPEDVQDEFGYGLHQVQAGLFPSGGKPLKGFSGVVELVSNYNKNTYRVVYAIKIDDRLFVLHAFQKKSKTGIETPKKDVELIRQRLLIAKELARGGK